MVPSPAPSRSRRPWLVLALTAVAPWSWFLLRNLGWPAEPVAAALPLWAGGIAGLSTLVALGKRSAQPLVITASALVFTTVAVLAPRMPQRTAPPVNGVRIVSANVYSANPEPGTAAEALAATDADVLIAVETRASFSSTLDEVDRQRPFVAPGPQIVVRSRWPVTPTALSSSLPESRVLRAIVQTPSGPLVVYAVHALNPAYESTFARQLGFVERLTRAANRETEPVVIAGDFNMSDRQLGYRRLASAFRDAARTGWAGDTFDHSVWRLLFLRIDYVFIDRSWCATDAHPIDVPGSDHDGVETTVGACPGATPSVGPSP